MKMEKQLFARKASGLVRNVSSIDAWVFSLSAIGPTYLTTTLVWMLSWKPAADIAMAAIITAVFSVGAILCWSFFINTMPRTGADYVYISRSVHPALGLMSSWTWVVAGFFWTGWMSYFTATFGIPLFLTSIGIATRNVGLLSLATNFASGPLSTAAPYILAIPYIWVLALGTVIISARTMLQYLKVFLGLSLLGTFIAVVILALTPQATFVSSYNALINSLYPGAGGYQSVINAATSSGFVTSPPFSWADTLSLVPIIGSATLWAMEPTFVGGELKQVKKSSFFSVLGGLAAGCLVLIVIYYATVAAVGHDFATAISYVSSNNPSALPFVTSPQIYLLASIVTNNPVLAGLMGFSFIAMALYYAPLNVFPQVRYLFAYSMDRLMPEWMTTVNRWHSPKYAGIVVCAGATVFAILFAAYPDILLSFTYISAVWPWLFVSFAAIVFPFLKKDIFEASPVNWRVGKVPAMSIAGVAGVIFVIALLAIYGVDPAYGGGGIWAWVAAAVILVMGLLIFYIARAIRKRQGIDVDLAFREIPPI